MRALLALLLALAAPPVPALTEEPLPAPLTVPAEIIGGETWMLLSRTTAKEKEVNGTWIIEKTFDPALDAMDGAEVTLTGYAVPLSAGETVTRLLLVQSAADCPFCGGGYGPVVEVELDLGLAQMPEFSQLTVTGRLVLIRDPDTFQTFRLESARAEGAG